MTYSVGPHSYMWIMVKIVWSSRSVSQGCQTNTLLWLESSIAKSESTSPGTPHCSILTKLENRYRIFITAFTWEVVSLSLSLFMLYPGYPASINSSYLICPCDMTCLSFPQNQIFFVQPDPERILKFHYQQWINIHTLIPLERERERDYIRLKAKSYDHYHHHHNY